MSKFISYGRQDITQEDIDAVTEVLRSDFLTQGPAVSLFEESLQQYCNARFALATNSATSALHISCLALGLKPNDYLWTTAISFVASANCALYCGAKVDFVDIDPDTNNMCPIALQEKLKLAERDGTLPKILVIVHLCGLPADLESIRALSYKYGFSIIEDASHAIGASYNNSKIGSCTYSDITVFSFHPVKIITSAEGGATLTNNQALHEKMELLRSHGVTRNKKLMENPHHPSWYYEQVELGFNYRMTDLQAALGKSQIIRLDDYINKRYEIANYYHSNLSELPIILPYTETESSKSSLHLYVIKTEKRDQIFEHLRKENIGANLHYIPIYRHPFYEKTGLYKNLPNAEEYYKKSLTIPLHPKLEEEEKLKIVKTIIRAVKDEPHS